MIQCRLHMNLFTIPNFEHKHRSTITHIKLRKKNFASIKKKKNCGKNKKCKFRQISIRKSSFRRLQALRMMNVLLVFFSGFGKRTVFVYAIQQIKERFSLYFIFYFVFQHFRLGSDHPSLGIVFVISKCFLVLSQPHFFLLFLFHFSVVQ